MSDEPLSFVPEDVIYWLQTKPVQFVCWHKVAEYDNDYAIHYDATTGMFRIHIESSVWDGRGHEVADELCDEMTLRKRLDAIVNEGRIMSLGLQNLD